jgi:chemotaxis protein CheD
LAVVMEHMVLVGLGEMYLTRDDDRVLVARCLGSSAAVAIHDPKTGVSGLLHWMLPASRIDPPRAQRNPFLFIDTGLPRLLEKAVECGADRQAVTACLAGGAALPEGGDYDVGGRNRTEALRLLAQEGLEVRREETGGTAVRELSLEMGRGEFAVRNLNL